MAATAAIVLKLALRVPVVQVLLLMAAVGVTEIATSAASTQSAIGITATAAIVRKAARRLPVDLPLWATVLARLVALPRTAASIMAIAAIVLKLVRRVLAVLALLHGATVSAMETATANVSMRTATGMVATAAIFPKVVI